MNGRATPSVFSTDLYNLLEISPQARPEIVNAAYKTLMAIYHPDRNGGNDSKAKELSQAHQILSNPVERASYERLRRTSDKLQINGVIGDYRVLELIAEGGFGKTYKGVHILTREPVCIKDCSNVDPEYYDVLIEEAKAMWDLRHYSIPAVRNLLRLGDGSLALIMSYIPGPTLEKIVEKHGRLDPEHVAWIAERILNVLMYMHYNGVIHGDLKPQNVIIQPESHTVVVVDFGLSAVKPVAGSDVRGYTPHFAPPEQVDRSAIKPGSDFYSLGMTMVYALSGGLEYVKRKAVPQEVPEILCNFIRRLIVRDLYARPDWKSENLFETIQQVRKQTFGRASSNMKPLPVV